MKRDDSLKPSLVVKGPVSLNVPVCSKSRDSVKCDEIEWAFVGGNCNETENALESVKPALLLRELVCVNDLDAMKQSDDVKDPVLSWTKLFVNSRVGWNTFETENSTEEEKVGVRTIKLRTTGFPQNADP